MPLHTRIREVWGLDLPGGLVASYAALSRSPGVFAGFDPSELGSVPGALARLIETDRASDLIRPLGHAQRRLPWLADLFG